MVGSGWLGAGWICEGCVDGWTVGVLSTYVGGERETVSELVLAGERVIEPRIYMLPTTKTNSTNATATDILSFLNLI